MRAVPASLDPTVVAEIDARLAGAGVTIPWAIESGSRAWGFPSPDSDYDCRFLFVRPAEDYLSPWQKRDVLETPLDRVFDVNGWDLVKAVRLLTKGNAVVVEWLRSPIVYTGDDRFRSEFLDLAARVSNRALVGRHYLHVGRQKWNGTNSEMPLKKIFYSLRPAAVLAWMREHPDSTLPPMNLTELLEQAEPPADVVAETAELLAKKAVTRELGTGVVPPAISRFVEREFALAYDLYEHADGAVSDASRDLASEFFRHAVAEYGG
jgi:predicted nucleotidyltransferase